MDIGLPANFGKVKRNWLPVVLEALRGPIDRDFEWFKIPLGHRNLCSTNDWIDYRTCVEDHGLGTDATASRCAILDNYFSAANWGPLSDTASERARTHEALVAWHYFSGFTSIDAKTLQKQAALEKEAEEAAASFWVTRKMDNRHGAGMMEQTVTVHEIISLAAGWQEGSHTSIGNSSSTQQGSHYASVKSSERSGEVNGGHSLIGLITAGASTSRTRGMSNSMGGSNVAGLVRSVNIMRSREVSSHTQTSTVLEQAFKLQAMPKYGCIYRITVEKPEGSSVVSVSMESFPLDD